jgi:hypothetical protein
MTALRIVGAYALILVASVGGWLLLVGLALLVRRGWRWLRCATGHHREAPCSSSRMEVVGVAGGYYCAEPRDRLVWRCVDCGHESPYADGVLFTPSRRYALHRRAA